MKRIQKMVRLTPEQNEKLLFLADSFQTSVNYTIVLCIEGMYNKVKGNPQAEQMAQMLKDWRKQIQELFPTEELQQLSMLDSDYHPEG